MDEKRVKEWAVAWITERIDARRWCYHHLEHTRMFVEDVTEFGRASGVSAEELELLRVAGWLHDVGYAVDAADHEEVAAGMALDIVRESGGEPGEAGLVASLIRATKLSCSPRNLLEELMRDADLGRLGTEDFPERALLFRRELEQGGRHFSDLEFWRLEAEFLSRVNYFTEAARKLRGPGLERNRARVGEKVRILTEMSDQ